MTDQTNKTGKAGLTQARAPRGFADRGAADIAATDAMIAAIRQSCELYGFEAVETPFVEYTDALGKFLPDQDRPNEGVFSFQDDDEQWLSLRYDLTAPLARHVAENYDRLAKPYRTYRCGWVFRNEKPGPGRFRQFMQFDADTVGAASVAADAEMCMMAADTLEALGVPRGQYVVKVNNRKVLDGVMESVGLAGAESAARRLTVLRAIDKLDRLGLDGVRQLLGEGRKDESGDFTRGAGLAEHQSSRLLGVIDAVSSALGASPVAGETLRDAFQAAIDRLDELGPRVVGRMLRDDASGAPAPEGGDLDDAQTRAIVDFLRTHYVEAGGDPAPGDARRPWLETSYASDALTFSTWRQSVGASQVGAEGIAELKELARIVRAAGYGPDRIRIDPSVVRGLEYYTGPVFEAELTFEVRDDQGRPVRFGSVGGGGRYDGLVGRFRDGDVPATGFSIGVSRLHAALKAIGSPIVAAARKPGPVVVLAMDRDQVAAYQTLVSRLRAEGIAAEMYLGEAGMNPQLKYADRRGAVCVVIQGSNEREKGEVAIKDLVAGAELAKGAKTLDRDAYLALKEKAQIVAPEADLVKVVREVLARHA
jgi:histidyl-tRNA synthetase